MASRPQSGAGTSTGAPVSPYLTLGHVLTALGSEHTPPILLEDIHVIRHAFKPDGLRGPEDLTSERVLAYTRSQDLLTRRFPAEPGRWWVVLIADGKRRSRLLRVYENRGEVLAERTDVERMFDLVESDFMGSLVDRLVVDWTSPRNWHRTATRARGLPVLEIADRDKVPFPGFDKVFLSMHELKEMVSSPRYADWRSALSQVQGIYLITDSADGRQYVGKADGSERIFGRWAEYSRSGHGGNVELRALVADDAGPEGHARHFAFSILRVFGPSTSPSEVDEAESHYKRALMTRTFGLNAN